MAQYAIAYAPFLTGGAPAGTSQTGSFHIGNLTQGKVWNGVVPQSEGGNTLFFASPIANVNNAAPYTIAIPKSGATPTQPQFFYSATGGAFIFNDGAFITTCDYILKGYTSAGAVASPGSGAQPTGCNSVADCKTKINAAGWFQSYDFVPPA